MNIFFLDTNLQANARWHVDKHVGCMGKEAVQMLCTVLHSLRINAPYKPTHIHHPVTKWVGECWQNFVYTIDHAHALFNEYEYRYKKPHSSRKVLYEVEVLYVRNDVRLPKAKEYFHWMLTKPPIPIGYEEYDSSNMRNLIEIYRHNYYAKKKHLFKWTGRDEPPWITELKELDKVLSEQ